MKTSTKRLLQKMDQDLESLIRELSQYSHEQLNRPTQDGGWSPIQVMYHLIIAEEGSLQYLRKKLSFNPELKDTGMGDRYRSLMLNFYLWAPFKFKAPAGVSGDKLPVEADFQETAQRWKSSREELAQYLESLPEEVFNKSVYKHPFAGRMSLDAMLRFFSGHFSRHKKQIRKALK
jgi:hypothetical protein